MLAIMKLANYWLSSLQRVCVECKFYAEIVLLHLVFLQKIMRYDIKININTSSINTLNKQLIKNGKEELNGTQLREA